jgi:hypothetical protein
MAEALAHIEVNENEAWNFAFEGERKARTFDRRTREGAFSPPALDAPSSSRTSRVEPPTATIGVDE